MSENTENLTIWEHLGEVRGRLIRIVVALLLTSMICFTFAQQIIKILAAPIGGTENLQAIEITENIGAFMRVSLLSGFILAFPYILYQLLAFVFPGLNKNEKRWIIFLMPFATILFVSGVLFSNYFMLPVALEFLTTFMDIPTTPRLSNYINFVTNLLFWSGVIFEMPLLILLLAKLRIVTARQLVKYWRIAIVIIAVLAAVISPTVDPISMGLLMLPLLVLYLISILLAFLAVREKKNQAEE